MKRMRKCNDEIYQLAKYQVLVKKLKNKRFRPFCLCPPDVFKDIKERVFGYFFRYMYLSIGIYILYHILLPDVHASMVVDF